VGQLRKGDRFNKFSASEWNFIRARNDRLSVRDHAKLVPDSSSEAQDGIIRIVNATGANLEPGNIVGLDEAFITPATGEQFRTSIVFKGVLPLETYFGRFGLLLDGGRPDAVLPARVFGGPEWVQLSVARVGDIFADIYPGDPTKLRSGSVGSAQILYAVPVPGTLPQTTWACVRLGNLAGGGGIGCARLTMDMSDDYPEATAKRWEWNPLANSGAGDWQETSIEFRVRCFLRPAGETIANRTRFYYTRIGQIYEGLVWACAADEEDDDHESSTGGA